MAQMTDNEFFNNYLNEENAQLFKIKSCFNCGDVVGAKRKFAALIREQLDKESWYAVPFVKPPNFYMLPQETNLQAADRICRHEMISCYIPYHFDGPITWEINPTPDQFREWTFQLNRHNEWCILGEVYRKTGNEKYARCFSEMLQTWLDQTTPPESDVPFDATPAWRTLECGIRMGSSWPSALHDFCDSPLFTDDLMVEFFKSVCHHAERICNGKRAGNWLMHEMYALFIMGTVYPQLKDARRWREIGFSGLMEEMNRQFYPDGFHGELATGYHEAAAHIYIAVFRFARAYHIPLPQSYSEKIETILSLYGKIMLPDGRLPNINDGTWEKAAVYLKERLDLFPNRTDFQWIASNGSTGSQPDYFSIVLPYSGFAVMRNGWNKQAVWGLFDAGPFGTGLGMNGHQHEDKLNLLIYANGKLIVTEGGVYPYDESEMRKYIRTTRSHNTVRVNHLDQNRRSVYTWKEDEINQKADFRYFGNEEYDCAVGEYREGYGPLSERLAIHQRKVIFEKEAKEKMPCFFMVVDRLYAEEVRNYEFLWHIDSEQLMQSGMTLCADDLYFSVPENKDTSVNIVSGQTEPEWQGWKPGGVVGKYYPQPTVVYQVDAKNYRMVTVFIPLNDGKKHQVSVFADNDIDSTDIVISIDGKQYQFDESDYEAEPVSGEKESIL